MNIKRFSNRVVSGLFFFAIASIGEPLSAQKLTLSEDVNPTFTALEMNPGAEVVELAVDADGATTELINGQLMSRKHFPAILKMKSGGLCTASLVGPSTILLAAHCVDHNSRIRFTLSNGKSVRAICQQAPGYRTGKADEDWALCLLRRAVSGILFETLDLKKLPKPKSRVILSGFGCDEKGKPSDGRLRVGVSRVTKSIRPSEKSTLFARSDFENNEAILCPGDSGGPAFVFSTSSVADARRLIGVNSRTTYEYGMNFISAVASLAGKTFITEWADAHAQEICGLNYAKTCK